MGVQRSFPSTTTMIVADGRCATVSWVPITQHTEVTTVCDGPAGALTVPRFVTDESIAGTSTTSRVDVPRHGLRRCRLRPRRGRRWGVTCSLASPAEKVVLTGAGAGPGHRGGGWAHPLRRAHPPRPHLRRDRAHGTNPTDFWIVPSSGLIVRERESVAMVQGGVGYNENMDATLTGLHPAR